MNDTAGQFRIVLVHIANRGIMQLLGAALRLSYDRKREGVDHQPDQHPVMGEAAELFESEPETLSALRTAFSPQRSCLRRSNRLKTMKTGKKIASSRR